MVFLITDKPRKSWEVGIFRSSTTMARNIRGRTCCWRSLLYLSSQLSCKSVVLSDRPVQEGKKEHQDQKSAKWNRFSGLNWKFFCRKASEI